MTFRSKRSSAISTRGKTRITVYLDDATWDRFRSESEQTGKGFQTLIKEALAQRVGTPERPATGAEVRNIVREELAHHVNTRAMGSRMRK